VLQSPRPVFAALRDDSDEVAEARQDAAGAIIWLAGIAAVLATTVAGTLLDDPDRPPEPSKSCSVPIGRVFPFCEPFGTPKIHLFGLLLLRDQVVGARNGLWHLKPEFRDKLPSEWAHILSYGRTGFVSLEHERA